MAACNGNLETVSRTNGEKESSRLAPSERSQPRAVMPAAKLKASRPAVAGLLTYYAYDTVGNLTAVNYPISPNITLSYDAANRLTNMVDAVGTTKFGYTAASLLQSEDGPWSSDTVTYSYVSVTRSTSIQ